MPLEVGTDDLVRGADMVFLGKREMRSRERARGREESGDRKRSGRERAASPTKALGIFPRVETRGEIR